MSKKLIKFQIILDRDSLLYLPGQVLSGRVLLETQENTAVMGLYFHVLGECTVHFAKGARPDKSYDKESYIDFRMKLLDDFEHKPILLSPGVHCFPFKLGLPVSLPSTFLGKHGWIQYYCKASLQETSGIAHKNQQVFIVLNPIDLNLEEPMLSDPVEASVSHRVGVGYLGGTIRCNVGLDKRAYVPGENILLTGEIYNKSNVAIKSLKYALIETIQYFAHGKLLQQERRELAAVIRDRIKSGSRDVLQNGHLTVPPLPPTNLVGCRLIRIQYSVCILIEPNMMERQVTLRVPITLGTYPFKRDDANLQEWVENYVRYPATLPVSRAALLFAESG
ncbi:arrestin domain-containing protein 2-like isoform X1 [Toxorhynchites rutilus septentrionalis]|uniref:arrestin domain-containing protein 2-like isoform X1 n=1 Tax=Toxorhynchites rutilus septentrionalis TaxID=329112 RepID=UPI0024795682|nr:arrestin domain-containing protein 2-like isoform X1 [Toxorhynchites rutilus septentrionalis]